VFYSRQDPGVAYPLKATHDCWVLGQSIPAAGKTVAVAEVVAEVVDDPATNVTG